MQRKLEVNTAAPSPARYGALQEAYVALELGKRTRRSCPVADLSTATASQTRVTPEHPLVSVIDDDQSVRESLPDLLKAFGFTVRAFASAEDFLDSDCIGTTDCLVLDIAMPGMTGPELQKELSRRQKVPIVFITAHADDAMRSRVIDAGAVDCLLKPFSESSLLAALNSALGRDA
jgi:FixJ family two-component response regulator